MLCWNTEELGFMKGNEEFGEGDKAEKRRFVRLCGNLGSRAGRPHCSQRSGLREYRPVWWGGRNVFLFRLGCVVWRMP